MDASGSWAALECTAHPGHRNGDAMRKGAPSKRFIVRGLSDVSGEIGDILLFPSELQSSKL
jgi:hypothetical protein